MAIGLVVRGRRRGTALVDTPRGILVVREQSNRFSLPGGGARHHESREDAAIRELHEETGLEAVDSRFLFEHRGRINKSMHGGFYRDAHKVFLVTTTGVARPREEIKEIAYYSGSNMELEPTTKEIIDRYYAAKNDTLP